MLGSRVIANGKSAALCRAQWKGELCNRKRQRATIDERLTILEARGGIEPPIEVLQTSALPLGDRASGKARQETLARGEGREFWSGRRDLNPRLRPWQGRTLPLSYSRLFSHSTALAYLVTIHCTRTGTRSFSGCSSAWATAPPFG